MKGHIYIDTDVLNIYFMNFDVLCLIFQRSLAKDISTYSDK